MTQQTTADEPITANTPTTPNRPTPYHLLDDIAEQLALITNPQPHDYLSVETHRLNWLSALKQAALEGELRLFNTVTGTPYSSLDSVREINRGFTKISAVDKWLEKIDSPHRLKQATEVTERQTEKMAIFDQRLTSFDQWLKDSGADIEKYTIEQIHQLVKQRNKPLWNITPASFRNNFWQKLSKIRPEFKKMQGRKITNNSTS